MGVHQYLYAFQITEFRMKVSVYYNESPGYEDCYGHFLGFFSFLVNYLSFPRK